MMRGSSLHDEEVAALLERTSRTFALAIPLLGERLAREVGLAYLLFRIADTLEDADLWNKARRLAALRDFATWIDGTDDARFMDGAPPSANADYVSLLGRADDVSATLGALDPEAAAAIRKHVKRTALGMAEFVEAQSPDGALALADEADLRRYCYAVAGIVGELLTALFAIAEPSVARAKKELDENAAAFGEGLQLVNILKDAPSDARQGRVYLPRKVPRADIFRLARTDLGGARRYVSALDCAGASRGVWAFCELPLRLAEATLDCLESGAPKLGRDEALRIFASVSSSRQ